MSEVYERDGLYCVNHPQTETALRCNRCERPMCTRCVVLTPTGYRCKDCLRGQQRVFETAEVWDYPIAFTIAAVLSFIGSLVATVVGFFTFFIAPIAGVIVAEAVRAAVRRRRSRRLFQVATAGATIGSLVILVPRILSLLFALSGGGLGSVGLMGLLPMLWPALYTFMVTSAVYYRLAGIQLRR